jgi:hypothetical protein
MRQGPCLWMTWSDRDPVNEHASRHLVQSQTLAQGMWFWPMSAALKNPLVNQLLF